MGARRRLAGPPFLDLLLNYEEIVVVDRFLVRVLADCHGGVIFGAGQPGLRFFPPETPFRRIFRS